MAFLIFHPRGNHQALEMGQKLKKTFLQDHLDCSVGTIILPGEDDATSNYVLTKSLPNLSFNAMSILPNTFIKRMFIGCKHTKPARYF